ncbi:FtsW/RodA/SpoVE family cell cycle protein [Actinomarinicola tropica]|uniref:FtsW/RodA/SpoVE family cell cycle protein n=1 Tax=Actinomarinicola tropica TaxID=2789776 RepID=A0A5Q2RPZ4_9ACTN|nr:FtsW/RodA/SpoVE family cell cycle protein [Actinomarinicola tropica]QGG96641.1 FtsW/RodA/SpoVE family cell cycle protein [Actinomarinicola tropica]
MTQVRSLRRRVELGLIVLATIIVASAYGLAGLGATASLPADIMAFLGLVLALLVGAHIAVRRLAPNADGLLLPMAGLLNGIGYVFVARLDPELAAPQTTWMALGVVAFVVTLFVVRRPRDLERYRYTFLLIGIGLLLVPFVPGIGYSNQGATIWARIGPISFQPGEFAKLALTIFFAGYLVERRELLAVSTFRVGPLMLPDPKHLGPLLLAWTGALGIMVFQNELGSSLLLFTVFLVLVWVATERLSYLVLGGLLFAGGAAAAVTQFGHVGRRIEAWLDPWGDPDVTRDSAYQVVQAAYAMAHGGLTGTGIGLGNPGVIPVVTTDMIFAAIGEELGLVGATAVLIAFLLFVGAGLRTAVAAEQPFEKLLATGLSTLIAIQAFIIIGGVIRVLPLTGIALPFVAYGGSSLLANWVVLALLLRISDDVTTRQLRQMEGEAVGVR